MYNVELCRDGRVEGETYVVVVCRTVLDFLFFSCFFVGNFLWFLVPVGCSFSFEFDVVLECSFSL